MPAPKVPSLDRGGALIQLLKDGPLPHGTLIRRAVELGMSTATANRYLSELKAAGAVLSLGPSGYGLAPGYTPPSWGVMEIAYCEWLDVIQPDGSSWVQITSRFRVLWGSVTALPIRLFPLETFSKSHVRCRGNGDPYVKRVSADRSFPGCQNVEIEFRHAEPGPARDRELCVDYVAQSLNHRMFQGQYTGEFMEQHNPSTPWERAGLTVLDHAYPGLRRVLSPDAMLKVAVVLPVGFPVHGPRARSWPYPSVGSAVEPSAGRARAPPGFVRRDNVLTWTITQPELDRDYSIQWLPPSRAEYQHWLRRFASRVLARGPRQSHRA